MKRRLVLAVSLLSSFVVVPLVVPASTVSANPVGVFIFNTPIETNKGLGFCAPDTVKGCIDSITVGGVSLTPVSSAQQAQFGIGGGVYGGPCRFVDTTVSQCEYPYLVIYPMGTQSGQQRTLGDVVINFRRQQTSHPTSAVNAVIVNGSLQSFTPAAPGLRDIATISARAVDIQGASSGYCIGWAIEVDKCTIGETGTSKVTNRLSMLLLPAMRSSVVPPDFVDDTCRETNPTANCLINVFDETSRGGWVDTDASVFGLTSTDRFTGAAQLKIAGPHYKTPEYDSVTTPTACPYIASICAGQPAGTWGYTTVTVPRGEPNQLNLSYFRMFLPSAYLNASFGLRPNQANASTLPVRRTVAEGSTVPVTEYIPSADGLLVSSTGIGFSIPTMSVQRVLTIKRNQKITADSLLKAAGVFQTKKFGAAKITVNTRQGMKYSAKRYTFTKTRTVTVTIKYRSTKLAISERTLTVSVAK